MKEIRNETTRLTRVLTLFSILIVLSGMAAIVSADESPSAPIIFYGQVGVDGEWAESETTINASIDGKPCGSVVTTTEGRYRNLNVIGNESNDGETITFTIGGVTAGTAVWQASTLPTKQKLDLAIGTLPNSSPPPSTDDGSNGGGTSGGYIPPATTPTGVDAQPVSGELVTSAPTMTSTESTTSAANATKKLAEKPEAKGLLIGFEAVFAITGLLAVAYLIRRR